MLIILILILILLLAHLPGLNKGAPVGFDIFPAPYHAKNHRDKKERCDGGKQQPADHRPAQGRILLAAFARW